MTDEELNALVNRLKKGAIQVAQDLDNRDIDDAARAITTLRAQLAEAQKERNAVVATLVEVSRWWAKEEARAERAEAALAEQIKKE